MTILRLVSTAILVASSPMIPTAVAQQAISPFVIASGGGVQTGEDIAVVATIGQPIAAATDRLLAGFWYRSDLVAATSIEDSGIDPSLPSTFRLHQNYPNPFNPTTTIVYELPEAANVSIGIFDVLGRVVSQKDFDNQPAGVHSATWDGRDDTGTMAPSGAYWYRVQAGSKSSVKMMILLK